MPRAPFAFIPSLPAVMFAEDSRPWCMLYCLRSCPWIWCYSDGDVPLFISLEEILRLLIYKLVAVFALNMLDLRSNPICEELAKLLSSIKRELLSRSLPNKMEDWSSILVLLSYRPLTDYRSAALPGGMPVTFCCRCNCCNCSGTGVRFTPLSKTCSTFYNSCLTSFTRRFASLRADVNIWRLPRENEEEVLRVFWRAKDEMREFWRRLVESRVIMVIIVFIFMYVLYGIFCVLIVL